MSCIIKKIILIILLAFTTLGFANEVRHSMVKDELGVYISDSEAGKVKHCRSVPIANASETGSELVTACTPWSGEYILKQ
jgi:hypothetical protein